MPGLPLYYWIGTLSSKRLCRPLSLNSFSDEPAQQCLLPCWYSHHMQRCGKIRQVTIPLDALNCSKGYAYVRFEFWKAADKAMSLRPTQLGGKTISKVRRRNPYLVKSVSRICPVTPQCQSICACAHEHDTRLRQGGVNCNESCGLAAERQDRTSSNLNAGKPSDVLPEGSAAAVTRGFPDTISVTRPSAQLRAVPSEQMSTAQRTQDGPYSGVGPGKRLKLIAATRSDTAQACPCNPFCCDTVRL
jgi:hypothetical protein